MSATHMSQAHMPHRYQSGTIGRIAEVRHPRLPRNGNRQVSPCRTNHIPPSRRTGKARAVTRAKDSTAGRPTWTRRVSRTTRAPTVPSTRRSTPAKAAGAGRSPRRRRRPCPATRSRAPAHAVRSTPSRTKRAWGKPSAGAFPAPGRRQGRFRVLGRGPQGSAVRATTRLVPQQATFTRHLPSGRTAPSRRPEPGISRSAEAARRAAGPPPACPRARCGPPPGRGVPRRPPR